LARANWSDASRTAAILDSVAASCEHGARYHDDEAALEELDSARVAMLVAADTDGQAVGH
jgi:hypothetical protein